MRIAGHVALRLAEKHFPIPFEKLRGKQQMGAGRRSAAAHAAQHLFEAAAATNHTENAQRAPGYMYDPMTILETDGGNAFGEVNRELVFAAESMPARPLPNRPGRIRQLYPH